MVPTSAISTIVSLFLPRTVSNLAFGKPFPHHSISIQYPPYCVPSASAKRGESTVATKVDKRKEEERVRLYSSSLEVISVFVLHVCITFLKSLRYVVLSYKIFSLLIFVQKIF